MSDPSHSSVSVPSLPSDADFPSQSPPSSPKHSVHDELSFSASVSSTAVSPHSDLPASGRATPLDSTANESHANLAVIPPASPAQSFAGSTPSSMPPPRPVRPPKPVGLADHIAALSITPSVNPANRSSVTPSPAPPAIPTAAPPPIPQSHAGSLSFSPMSSVPSLASASASVHHLSAPSPPLLTKPRSISSSSSTASAHSLLPPPSIAPNAFASQVYHKYDIVCDQANAGIKVAKRVRAFVAAVAKIQERAAIEIQKAAQAELSKLIGMKPGDRMSSAFSAARSFLEKQSKLSYASQNSAIELNSLCVEPLNEFYTAGSIAAAQYEEEAKRIHLQTDALKVQVHKERESVKQALANLQEKRELTTGNSSGGPEKSAGFGLFTKNRADRLKEAEKAREKAHSAAVAFDKTVGNANQQYGKNFHQLPRILSEIQALEENRLRSLHSTFNHYSRVLTSYQESIGTLSGDIQQLAATIQIDTDFQGFIDSVVREYGAANAESKSPFQYDIGVKPEELAVPMPGEKAQNTGMPAGWGNSGSSFGASHASGGVFGSTLSDVLALDRRHSSSVLLDVPRIVPALIHSLETLGGLKTEGIFRISVSTDELNQAKKPLESGDYTSFFSSCMKWNNPHIPAALLKSWLRDLAEPLIPPEFYSKSIEIGKVHGELSDSHQSDLIHLIHSLPQLNRRVIYHLVDLMKRLLLADNVAMTRMTSANLGIVFSPSFLRNASSDPNAILLETKFASQFISHLIQYEANCFQDEMEWKIRPESGFNRELAIGAAASQHQSQAQPTLIKTKSLPQNAFSYSSTAPSSFSPLSSLLSSGSAFSSSGGISFPSPSHPPGSFHPRPPPSAPSPWRTVLDSHTGLNYYVNLVTQESTWNRPPELEDNDFD